MLKKIGFDLAINKLEEPFSPVELAEVNDHVIRASICEGEYPWHRHGRYDEFFYVYKGELVIETEEGDVHLGEREGLLIPEGVRHRPLARNRAIVLLFEPKALASAGD